MIETMPEADVDQFISPLSLNGLSGRMLHLPAPAKKKREILLVYGHHSSLERMQGFARCFNRYGSVTMPDLPGFGGMDSFYKIGKSPTIDNLADYLAAFIKLRFKKRPLTIVGYSLGFVIATRMLQKYPSLAGRVQLCVSMTGFVHRDDLALGRRKRSLLAGISRVLSWRVPAALAKLILRRPIIAWLYRRQAPKSQSTTQQDYQINFDTWLWQNNDMRTHFYTLRQMLTMNLCRQQIKLPVYHTAVPDDQYLDNHLIEQHMRVVFTDFHTMPLPSRTRHAPTILANAKEANTYIPVRLRRLLGSAPALPKS